MSVEAVDERAFLHLHESQRLVRVEAFHQHHAGAGQRHHQGPVVHAEDVEEGQVHEGAVAGADAEPIGLVGDVAEEAVGVDHPLRVPGASGREHDERGRVRVHRRRERRNAGRRDCLTPLQQLVPGQDAGNLGDTHGPVDDHPAKRRATPVRFRVPGPLAQLRSKIEHHREEVDGAGAIGEHQGRGVGRGQGVLEVVGAEADVEGQHHRPDLERAEEGVQPGGPVGEPQRELLPRRYPAARRPRAARSTSRSNSSKVQRRPSKTSASREPKRRAARDGRVPNATRSNHSPTGHLPLATPGRRVERTLAAPLGGRRHPAHGRLSASSRPRD